MTIDNFIQRLRTLDVWKIAYDVLSRHENDLVFVQLEQFAAGLNLAGEQMSPTILDDPFFEGNKKWARWWVENKDQRQSTIFAERRPKEVPNLIFSSGVIVWLPTHVEFRGGDLFLASYPDSLAADLEKKYGPLFGLNPQGAAYVQRAFFREEVFREVRKHLFG
jgi:hypothetical protein